MLKIALAFGCVLLGACGGIAEAPQDSVSSSVAPQASTTTPTESIPKECQQMTYYYFKLGLVTCGAGAPLCGFDGGAAFVTTLDKAYEVCYCQKGAIKNPGTYGAYVCEKVR